MKNLILSALLLSACTAFAQKEKKHQITENTQAVYAVADDGKTKDGLYAVRNTKDDGAIVQGYYKNNSRAGTWYFFDNQKKLSLRYNYDTKKMLYYDKKQLDNVEVKILKGSDEEKKNASAPLPLCSTDYLAALLLSRMPQITNAPGGELDVVIDARVGADGNARYTVGYKTEKGDYEKQVIKLDDNSEQLLSWIPANYNGKNLDADFIMVAKFNNDPNTQRRTRWYN
ncbi:hypothetical protein LT679_08485 [Mucilaginibacter roseus]|uniref:DUF3108 domain-containing protein n=1 Tax=Mucilaginibacter roseus TaxID=1528868 RepID=A0ABS8U570_9SPHI|nr:hypothetical protein [Mucilaginibacter roseus]MCD8740633.1 hypothetical protein [Mucilaginibacter roseus]